MHETIKMFVEQTRAVLTEKNLRSLYLSAMEAEGFENVVFARVFGRRLASVVWSEFPTGYLDAYTAQGWDRIDPVVQQIHKARTPFWWVETGKLSALTRYQRKFFNECRELGVHTGLTIPIRGIDGSVDLISLSRRSSEKWQMALADHAYLLSFQYWIRYCELVDKQKTPDPILSAQEIECLLWCKEGKTNWEIGEIMQISEKTVEFHVTNIIRKLGAANRMSAVIAGIRAGLISL